MDHSVRYRLGFWAILILVLVNIGTLGLLWHEHFKKPPQRPRDGKADPEEFFVRELQLDQEQADSVKVLRRVHFQQTDSIRFELTLLSRQMMEEVFAPSPDTVLVRELSEQIGREQSEFERRVYEHFDKIKQLCQPEQHEKLRRLILDALRAKQPPPRGGQGGDCIHGLAIIEIKQPRF